MCIGDAFGKQHENTATLYRLPQRAQHRYDDRGDFVFYCRTLWFSQVWRKNRGQHNAKFAERRIVSRWETRITILVTIRRIGYKRTRKYYL